MTQQEERAAKALQELASGMDLEHMEHAQEGNDYFDLENLAAMDPKIIKSQMMLLASRRKINQAAPIDSFRAPLSAATLTIQVERQLTVVPSDRAAAYLGDDLPAPIFGVLEQASDWYRVINRYITPGANVKVKSVGKTVDRASIVITYQNAADTTEETVTISRDDSPYTNLLAGLQSAYMEIVKPKMEIIDATNQMQFKRGMRVFDGTMFSKTTDDVIKPNEFKSDLQNQNDIRTIMVTIPVDNERCLVPSIVPPNETAVLNAKFSFSLTCYIQRFNKVAEFVQNRVHKIARG